MPVLSPASSKNSVLLPRRTTEKDKLILKYTNLVWSVVHKFSVPAGCTKDDLFQVGMIALTKAVDRYDSDKGDNLCAYARVCISGQIKNWLYEQATLIRIPPKKLALCKKVQAYIKDNPYSSRNQVCEALGISEKQLLDSTKTFTFVPLLEGAMGAYEQSGFTEESEEGLGVEEILNSECLTPNEAYCLKEVYVNQKTKTEVAKSLQVGKSTVGYRVSTAIKKLQRMYQMS